MSFLVVNRHNLSSLSLSIKHSIQNATFISIDTEFTGLGQNKQTRAQNVEDRYAALKSVACSHSVIGVGMSVFTAVPPSTDDDEDGNGDDGYSQNDHIGKKRSLDGEDGEQKEGKKKCHYRVENFDFRLLSLADHMVSPASLTFLVQHGFDFNDQYLNGIPYYPGDVPPDSLRSTAATTGQKEDSVPSISARNIKNLECNTIFRGIIMDVLLKKCPIVLHNGLLDLIFLYQSFYAQLPPTLPVFIADCSEMFHGAGIFDTKYISDFMTRESASFLSLLFRKYQRAQSTREANGESFVNITFKDPISFKPIVNPAKLHELGLAPNISSKASSGSKKAPVAKSYCEQYANHGFCVDGKTCLLSHDLDVILDDKVGPLPPAAKKLKPHPSGSHSASSKTTTATSQMGNLFEQDHSACYDAFMTGYVFAHQMMTEPDVLQEARNKIYLIGKQIPLLIEQSKYAKPSTSHLAIRQKYKL